MRTGFERHVAYEVGAISGGKDCFAVTCIGPSLIPDNIWPYLPSFGLFFEPLIFLGRLTMLHIVFFRNSSDM